MLGSNSECEMESRQRQVCKVSHISWTPMRGLCKKITEEFCLNWFVRTV